MKIDLDERERKAKAACPGPWQWYGNTKMHGHPDAEHIAENDPTSTLAVIAYVRELEAALGQASRTIASSYEDKRCTGESLYCPQSAAYDALLARGPESS